MNDLLTESIVTCPHCWERISITVDLSAGNQSYVEDCQVCCNPMTVMLLIDAGELQAVEVEPAQ